MSHQYNEVTHSNMPDYNSLDPMFHWDTHFPERLSKLDINSDFKTGSPTGRSRNRRSRNRQAGRFKTQPITFDEIKEVDEENTTAEDKKKQELEGLKSQFTAFSRSMDGLVPSKEAPKFQFVITKPSPLSTTLPVPATQPVLPLQQQNPNVQEAPAATGEKEVSTATSVESPDVGATSSSDPAAASQPEAVPSLANMPTHLQRQYDRRRKKSKKSRAKGIQEVPEPDKVNNNVT